ncbi:subtilisin-like protein [Lentinula edodes]|uniref:subtilisin-like protein n=1 Tax=Lentinula edodes TaxID=5353 RepID=UPI001E8DB949|nr:subtilisin-like protein [Lentinula edodes]KAH7871428.1 subtilisin-like protein [Lentinula edodes]
MVSSSRTTWSYTLQLVLSLLSIALTHGAPNPNPNPRANAMSIHDRRTAVPKGYTPVSIADFNSMIQMRISLTMGNRTGLEDALNKASDPEGEGYGRWLSREDVQYYAAPSRDALYSVRTWLASNNITPESTTVSGDWITFNVSVGTAGSMLNATYNVYEHTASGKQSVRTLEYSVPEEVREHIRAIHPTTSFYHSAGARIISLSGHHKSSTPQAAVNNKASSASTSSSTSSSSSSSSAALPTSTASFSKCNDTVTPACLQTLYGLPTGVIKTSNSTIGVSAFAGQDANKADLASFLKLFRPDLSSDTFATQLLDNATNSQTLSDSGIEADLDIQYTVGLANGIPTTFVDVGDDTHDGDDGGFLDIVNDLLAETNPPLVLTTSYGVAGDESGLSRELTFAMCDAFMKLTARGVTILYATGDGGVASSPGEDCDDEPFLAAWPTCPYATLVGATTNIPEKGADLSAGGFSNYFTPPSWQQPAVASYLAAIGDDLYQGRFNRSGRGFPDVSAQGDKIQIVQGGAVTPVAGTSASSPIFAAVVALLNDELLGKGKPPMGFMNPWIYAHMEAFNDITDGSNPGCGTTGFPALEGWDPVTGVGSPNYQAMRKALGLS